MQSRILKGVACTRNLTDSLDQETLTSLHQIFYIETAIFRVCQPTAKLAGRLAKLQFSEKWFVTLRLLNRTIFQNFFLFLTCEMMDFLHVPTLMTLRPWLLTGLDWYDGSIIQKKTTIIHCLYFSARRRQQLQ